MIVDVTKSLSHDKSVSDVMSTTSTMANPFNVDQTCLACISRGVVLDDSIADDLLGAEWLGESQFSEFCETNLFGDSSVIFLQRLR